MKNSVTKQERLLNLIALLLNTRVPVTADEIRQRLEGYPEQDTAFRRTFERDKDELRDLGVPIEVVAGDGAAPAGYLIAKQHYALPELGLTSEEQAALRAALVMVQLGDEDEAVDQTANRKIGGGPRPASAETVAELPRPDALPTLFDAVRQRRLVTFTFHDLHRELEPYQVRFQRGKWYLAGFDRSRGEDREFRIDRITGPIASGEPNAFTPREDRQRGPIQPWTIGPGPAHSARLLVDADFVPIVRNILGREIPWEQRPDGSAVATVTVTNPEGFRNLALSLLDHVEILEPAELRHDLVQWLREIQGAA